MVKKIQYFIVLISLVSTVVAFTAAKKPGTGGVKTIVIDAGHGGRDPGCHGVTYKEKDVALAVALKLGKYIEENFQDVKVIYTRTTDVFVDLEDRAQIANKAKADLFISIHCNAAGKAVIIKDPKTGKKRKKMRKNAKGKMVPVETINPEPFGTETYVMAQKNEEGKMRVATRENSVILLEDDYEKKYGGFNPESVESYIIMSNYSSAYLIQSANLAVKIQDEYTKKAGRIDKGVHRQSIWVLWRTAMPSILTEIGYLTNPMEETFLGSETGQDYLAKAMFRGVRKYKDEIEGTKKEYNDAFENQPPIENENLKAGILPPQKKSDEDELEDEDKKTDEPTGTTKKAEAIDSLKALADTKSDTAISAKDIALKYKNKTKNTGDTKTLTPTPVKTLTPVPSKTTNVAASDRVSEIVFKVQFASSDMELDLNDPKYAALNTPVFYKAGGKLKYVSGNFTKFKTAVMHQNVLRNKGFSDCFVVAFKNGERIDLKEAQKMAAQ